MTYDSHDRAHTFIIAEAGVNHNGDIDLAKRLIDAASAAGADAVKFQTFKAATLVTATARKAEYQVANTNDDGAQLDMLRALDEHNRMRSSSGKVPIHIGIGINTGPVIAGAIGSSQTLQYTVIGDAVNTAARLCGVAQAGEVIISGSTRGPIEAHVIAETREPVTVKGKSQPLPIWRVTGIHEHAPPREA